MTAKYNIYMLDLNGTAIDAMTDQTLDGGAQIVRGIFDGGVAPTMTHISSVDPNVNCSSKSIGKFLAAIGADPCMGMAIGASDAVILFCAACADLGAVETTGAMKATVNKGMVLPQDFSCSNDSPGSINISIIPLGDGTNSPITTAISQSLAGSPDADEQWYPGPVVLNNVLASGIESCSGQFGINFKGYKEAGQVQNTTGCIESAQPVLSFVSRDVSLFHTYQSGVAISSATKLYLRKAKAHGSRELDATAVHCQFTVNSGMIIARRVAGSPQLVNVDIIPNWDGTNALIVFALAAITV
ncbi:MAG: hypothetical protein JEZ07_06485 [Phycisphaerae bacterium]|nr:hypothetical protein [Phycisphaerae bacterium]